MFLAEERLEELWPDTGEHSNTVLGCIRPIMRGIGDITEPHTETIRQNWRWFPLILGSQILKTSFRRIGLLP
jgi:chromosome partitioning protein